MAVNLVSLVMQFLTPDMIGRIASALGLDRNNALTAIGAGVPGLLAGLSGVALQPGGGQRLVDSAKQYTGTLGNFASMLGTGDQTSFVEKGSQMLASLLGGGNQTALAGAVAKFAGLGQGASGSLLGMLAPVVMGTIAQQQGTHSLNASGNRRTTCEPEGQYCRGAAFGFRQSAGRHRPARFARRCGANSDWRGQRGGTGCHDRGPSGRRYRPTRRGRGVVRFA